MDYGRIHRLLKILTLIQGEKGWTAARLAAECGTTERTIYRDMKMLEGAGIPYFFDDETKGYRVRKDFFMPPVQLTLDESLALAALAERVGGDEQVPFTEAAAKAISKVRSALPQSIRSELEQIEDHVAIKLAAASPPESSKDVYRTTRSAIVRKTALRCRYDSLSKDGDAANSKKAGETFLFQPYTLFFNQRAWYVVGHHEGRREVRCLKLNRFTKLEATSEHFKIPKAFSLEKHLGNAWRMIRGKKAYDVELWFDPEFAETVSDTHWHKTQDVEWNDDDSITFRCRVDGLEEIVWWVLGYGPHCRVRQPKELAERVKALGLAIAENYAKQPPMVSKS
jgi:proteasome accessory factor B